MDIFGEFLGTALLVLLGNGVVAGLSYPKLKTMHLGGSLLPLDGELQLLWQLLSAGK